MKEIVAASLIMTGAFAFTGTSDYEEAVKEHEHYCAMYRSWIKHSGTAGHPNYDNRDCSTLEWWDQ